MGLRDYFHKRMAEWDGAAAPDLIDRAPRTTLTDFGKFQKMAKVAEQGNLSKAEQLARPLLNASNDLIRFSALMIVSDAALLIHDDYDKSIRLREEAIAVDYSSSVRADNLFMLGKAQELAGSPTQARASYQGALIALQDDVDPARQPLRLLAHLGISSTWGEQGWFDRALAELDEARSVVAEPPSPDIETDLANIGMHRGECLRQAARFNESVAAATEAAAAYTQLSTQCESWLRDPYIRDATTCLYIAVMAAAGGGDPAKATSLLSTAAATESTVAEVPHRLVRLGRLAKLQLANASGERDDDTIQWFEGTTQPNDSTTAEFRYELGKYCRQHDVHGERQAFVAALRYYEKIGHRVMVPRLLSELGT